MKRFIRTLVLAVALITGLTTISAQTVQVVVIQKVPSLPSTITSYLDNPFHYFDIRFILSGAGSEGLDIYFDMNMTVNSSSLYVRTDPNKIPVRAIHLKEGVNKMTGDELNTQVLNRTDTNFDYSNILDAQQLPEGTYTLCVDVHRWSDWGIQNPESLTIGPCPQFDICYSGSAPELVSPLAGAQMALNGTMVLKPIRKVNFFWTPVISNCAGKKNQFNYKLKVVKVFPGQNYQDAINTNPTVLSTEVRNTNTAAFDTVWDVKIQMEKGALYVAQVQAEQIKINTRDESFIIANDGKSQPMPFYWDLNNGFNGWGPDDVPPGTLPTGNLPTRALPHGTMPTLANSTTKDKSSRKYGYSVEYEDSEEGDESEGVEGVTLWDGGVEEVSELETIQDETKEQYLAGFIQDAAAVANLTKTYPDERQYVPTPKRLYVESDGYYTVPMSDDLEISFMPTRHTALKKASYAIELYDYVDGGIDSITSFEPLLSEMIEELPERYNKMDSHELVKRTLSGWGNQLEQGNRYYLQLSSFYTVGYWKYAIADTSFYVNEMLAEHKHDTVSRDFVEEELTSSNGVMFQWGNDPKSPDFKTPQWKAPVDRTSDDIYDPMNYRLPSSVPEVQKAKSFQVSWIPVKNVTKGDNVEYEVKVYELKPDQTLEEAISANEVLVSRTVTNANEIAEDDSKFFKVFSPKKTYVMTLSTNVNGESDTYYHFENGNKALPIVFKVVK